MAFNLKDNDVKNSLVFDTKIVQIQGQKLDEEYMRLAKQQETNLAKKGYIRVVEYEQIKVFFGEVLADTFRENVEANIVVLFVRKDSLLHRIFDDESEREKYLDENLNRGIETLVIKEATKKYSRRACPINVQSVWETIDTDADGLIPKFDNDWNVIHKELKSGRTINNATKLNEPTVVVPVREEMSIDSIPLFLVKEIIEQIKTEDETRKKTKNKAK